MSVIRSAGLRGFREVVAELGGDPESYALRSGLPVAAIDEDDLLVNDVALATAYEIAADELRCPDLGLRISVRQDLGMLGPLALAIQNSPTVRDALECASRYLFVHAQSMSITLEPDPYETRGVVAVRYSIAPGLEMPVQSTDVSLAFLHHAIGFLVGGPYGLRTVELPYEPVAPLANYEEFFGVKVRINRPQAMLRVPASLAALPIRGGDESLRRLAVSYLAEQSPDQTLVPRVRGAVTQSLGTSQTDIASVARLLAMHQRTLQRRLAEEGTTFAAILDDVRRVAARRYLTTTELPLSQVAGLLGLSEQSALTRCCRRWWATTPSQVRRGPDPARVRSR